MPTLDPRSERTVIQDRWDRARYEETAWKVSPFRRAREQLHQVTPTAWAECEDLFQLFVKSNGQLAPEETVRDDHKINWQVNCAVKEHPKFPELRWMTAGDAVGAALAVRDFMPELVPLYKRKQKLQEELQKQQERQEERLKALEDFAKAQDEGDEEGASEAQERADGLGDEIEAQAVRLDGELEAFGSAAQAAVARGMGKAVENCEATQTLARGWDLTPADLARQDPEDRLALAKLVQNDRIKQAAEFLGALLNMANTVVRMRQGFPHQTKGITMGDDLDRVLAEEMVMLDDEDMVWQFFAAYSEMALLQYNVEGEEHKGKGGLAVGVDISMSMNGAPISWAIALAMALFIVAQREKRPFVCVFFNTQVRTRIHLSPDNFIKNLAEMASIGASGGTCFTEPLDQLLEGLEAEATATTTQSDVVLITDDQCAVPGVWLDQYHRRMDKIGGKTWGIAVKGRSKEGPLWDICQGAVWSVSDFHPQATRPIKAIFEAIAAYRRNEVRTR